MTDFLNELNQAQQAAVKATDGAVMVIAGAGSGKTRVLTYRIAWLLNQGVEPYRVLALTFTNKAAREMRERISHLVDASAAKGLWMGTFHSIFARILRIEAHRLDFPQNFTIYDTDDSKRLLRQIIKEQQLDDKTYHPGYLLGRISNAKNNLISASDYNEDTEIQQHDIQIRKPKTGLIYSLYQQRLKKASAMDFDDLLFNTNVLLRDFPDALYKYQQRFSHILVDEYQDTNYSQYLIVKKLAANNENICVVGDDAQSIYAFRGANIRNILNFKKDYPDYQLFKLEQNYRSSKHIVQAANSVIAKNKDQIQKEVWTENEAGEKIQIVRTSTEGEESSFIAGRIFELRMNQQRANQDFAILYRTNAQSRALEEALRRKNIPYRIFGGVSFYQRKEIKDVLAYFRLLINPYDEDALLRVINFPARGIGQTTVNKLLSLAADSDRRLWDIISDEAHPPAGLHSGIMNRLREFTEMMKALSARLYMMSAYELGELVVMKTGIRKLYFEDGTPEGINRRDNVEELLSGLKDFSILAGEEVSPGGIPLEEISESDSETTLKSAERAEETITTGQPEPGMMRTLDEFMQDIALLTDADIQLDEDGQRHGGREKHDRVSLMTIHAAKGLEFPFVFIAGVEENLFPSQLSVNSRQELEEERRLFYVALTRAMKRAFITYTESRFRYGNFHFCEPSRFIDELDEAYIEHTHGSPGKKSSFSGRNQWDQPPSVKPADPPAARPGPGFKPLKKATTSPLRVSKHIVSASPGNSETAKADQGTFRILDPKELKSGMRVMHERFGAGQVTGIEGAAQNAKASVNFDKFGPKQLLLRFARLQIITEDAG